MVVFRHPKLQLQGSILSTTVSPFYLVSRDNSKMIWPCPQILGMIRNTCHVASPTNRKRWLGTTTRGNTSESRSPSTKRFQRWANVCFISAIEKLIPLPGATFDCSYLCSRSAVDIFGPQGNDFVKFAEHRKITNILKQIIIEGRRLKRGFDTTFRGE